jgi:hypothetical protein
MKRLLLASAGFAIALSLGAQTTTNEEKQEPQGKATTEENAKANQPQTTDQNVQPTERERARTNVQEKARSEQGGAVSYSTTVFRNGRETNEHLALHRNFRERNDVHFSIGTHPRDWWLKTYVIVLIDGCHYYMADNGCWYPAYGFDPTCNYPEGVVYCD